MGLSTPSKVSVLSVALPAEGRSDKVLKEGPIWKKRASGKGFRQKRTLKLFHDSITYSDKTILMHDIREVKSVQKLKGKVNVAPLGFGTAMQVQVETTTSYEDDNGSRFEVVTPDRTYEFQCKSAWNKVF